MWILSLLLSITASAASNRPVVRAHKLALKKDRQGACRVLVEALKSTHSAKEKTRLIEEIDKISKMFFTDKGQRLYELGQSSMFENPSLSLTQLQSALKLESNNILILEDLARLELARRGCDAAETDLTQARELNPQSGTAAVLELQVELCREDYVAFREKVKALPPLKDQQEAFVQYMTAQDLLQQKLNRKAFDVLTKVTQDLPKFPEAYYQLWRAGEDLGRDMESAGQKYVSLCKGLTIRQRKHYDLEPRLCVKVKEVEDELAKKNNDL